MSSQFKQNIYDILNDLFENQAEDIFELSPLIQYLEIKTRSAERGSKARGSFGNLYALYVLIEDYINKNYSQHYLIELVLPDERMNKRKYR